MRFKDQGLGFRVLGSDFRVQGSGFRVWCSRFFGQGVVSMISDFGFTVEGLKLSLQGLGFGIKVLDSGSRA